MVPEIEGQTRPVESMPMNNSPGKPDEAPKALGGVARYR
jgi:hypothetical protein